jgi:thioredoxin 1
MKELNNQQEITSLLEEKQSFMLYCSTQTCMPCKILKPEIENNLSEFNDKMNYISLEKTEDLAVKFNFKSVPTILFFKEGELVNKGTGTKELTLEFIKNNLLTL